MAQNLVKVEDIQQAFILQKRISKIKLIMLWCVLGLIVISCLNLFNVFKDVVVDSYSEAIFHLVYPFLWVPLLIAYVYGLRQKGRLEKQLKALNPGHKG